MLVDKELLAALIAALTNLLGMFLKAGKLLSEYLPFVLLEYPLYFLVNFSLGFPRLTGPHPENPK